MPEYQGISTLEVLEEAKKYNRWIAENLLPHLVSPVLEIGAGTGNISHHFLHCKKLVLSEVDNNLLRVLEKTFKDKENVRFAHLDITKPFPKEYANYFQTILGVNVLEHIEHDAKVLKNLFNALQKGGRLLLLVPAKKIAYTKLDREVGHFRRYEKQELLQKLQEAGFTVEKLYFFNTVGLISWMVRDKIGKSPYLKPQHIALFDMIVPILKRIEKFRKPPVGISLIAIARK